MSTTFLLYTAGRINFDGYCFQEPINAGISSVVTCIFFLNLKWHAYIHVKVKKKNNKKKRQTGNCIVQWPHPIRKKWNAGRIMRWVWHLSSPQTFHFGLTGDWSILCTLARSLARDESAPAPPPHLPLIPSSLFSKPATFPTVHHYPHPSNNNEQRALIAKKGPRRRSAVKPNSQFVPFSFCFLIRKKLIDSTLVTLSNAAVRHSGWELLKSKYCRLLLTSNTQSDDRDFLRSKEAALHSTQQKGPKELSV